MGKNSPLRLTRNGPYLIHCGGGKDLAGYVSAFLEALMDAAAEDIAGGNVQKAAENYRSTQPG
jgi:protein tyrosine/serine phosphatase